MYITVFEQNGSGQQKIKGIEKYGDSVTIKKIIQINGFFPDFIDDPENYLNDSFDGDLVLDYLTHPDLSHYLVSLCKQKSIPVVSSGKKNQDSITPFTCCGLGQHKGLGPYGQQFGFPEYRITLEKNIIVSLEVIRGAPCGASWEIIEHIIGRDVEEAMSTLPREVQYRCSANPSRFDPVSGKSPVHYAGYVHRAALKKAMDAARQQWKSCQET
jgi:hypothetical protein